LLSSNNSLDTVTLFLMLKFVKQFFYKMLSSKYSNEKLLLYYSFSFFDKFAWSTRKLTKLFKNINLFYIVNSILDCIHRNKQCAELNKYKRLQNSINNELNIHLYLFSATLDNYGEMWSSYDWVMMTKF